MNKSDTIVTMHRDGTMRRLLPDGTEQMMPSPEPLAPMTDEQIHAAALADPDAQPLTDADMARMKQTPRLKIIRRALGMTQEEFSARFQIPVGTLRDWEQGKKEPDQAARAYLRAIAGDAQGVLRALQAAPQPG